MPSDWKEDALHHKYDPLPDEPRHRKKAKKRHVRSDHRHDYEKVCVDAQASVLHNHQWVPSYYVIERCRVCGRMRHTKGHVQEVPKGMPLYRVDGLMGLWSKELGEERRVR